MQPLRILMSDCISRSSFYSISDALQRVILLPQQRSDFSQYIEQLQQNFQRNLQNKQIISQLTRMAMKYQQREIVLQLQDCLYFMKQLSRESVYGQVIKAKNEGNQKRNAKSCATYQFKDDKDGQIQFVQNQMKYNKYRMNIAKKPPKKSSIEYFEQQVSAARAKQALEQQMGGEDKKTDGMNPFQAAIKGPNADNNQENDQNKVTLEDDLNLLPPPKQQASSKKYELKRIKPKEDDQNQDSVVVSVVRNAPDESAKEYLQVQDNTEITKVDQDVDMSASDQNPLKRSLSAGQLEGNADDIEKQFQEQADGEK